MKAFFTLASLGLIAIAVAVSAISISLDVVRFPELPADEPSLTAAPANSTPAHLQPAMDIKAVQPASGDRL